ncbi:MAG: tRNA pseudouridine(55) synthase TruB [Pseudomonadota bacterium]
MDGVIVINKQIGPTSHDVVNRVRVLSGSLKVGHLGTLDPLASGVLPLVLGAATKLASSLAGSEKIYEFTCCFGEVRTTDDSEGEIISKRAVPQNLLEELRELLPGFIGVIDQRPPLYSAIKIKGRPMYSLARKGKKVEAPLRRVTVNELKILKSDGNRVRMSIDCLSGTYVRSICRDLGFKLGCGAYASDIFRLKSGRFTIDQAITMDILEKNPSQMHKHIIGLEALKSKGACSMIT